MTGTPPDDFHGALSSVGDADGDVDAILAPGRTPLRFAELLGCVTTIRETLNRMGIGRGDRVVAVLPSGPETAVCFFGVAACATYVPLDPNCAEEEFTRYLARLQPRAVLVPHGDGAAIKNAATRSGIPALELVAIKTGPAGKFEIRGDAVGAPRKPEWAPADDLALILLTSGVTAQPKLVPIRQRHILALARAGKAHFALGREDRLLHVMPMFHGHGLKSGLAMTVLAGSSVICASPFDAPSFFAAMAALRPTWYSASYTIHQAILDRVHEYHHVASEARLRFVVSGSGKIDPKVVRGLEAAFGAPFLDRYSMSETGFLTCDPLPPGIRKPGSVGKPLLNEVRIADERGGLLGNEREGEVVARGPGVFNGYLDDPDANARAFVNGWFRTGDLGHFDGDGYLKITGRIKELINRGGEKIGPPEIESVLAQHPGVARACVFGIPHPTLGQEVAAAVVPVGGSLVNERSVIDFAKARLAGHKVPRCIVFTAEFPQTPSGKIDRKALAHAYGAAQEYATPATRPAAPGSASVEAAVAGIWRKLLNVEHIRTNLDFFLAGGDSIKATELINAIRHQIGVHLNIRDIFDDGATVQGLVALIERTRDEKGSIP